jgi:hypothetical protein
MHSNTHIAQNGTVCQMHIRNLDPYFPKQCALARKMALMKYSMLPKTWKLLRQQSRFLPKCKCSYGWRNLNHGMPRVQGYHEWFMCLQALFQERSTQKPHSGNTVEHQPGNR